MQVDLFAFLTFAVITSTSPGPNNISAMAFSMSMGYKRTLPYILGIVLGTFTVMFLCAWMSFALNEFVPSITKYLKYIGAAYILYLAYKTYRVNYNADADDSVKPQFKDGMLLQLVNPKAIFYGMTVYSTFFASLVDHKLWLTISVLGLAIFTFITVSVWAGFGTVIKHYMTNERIKRAFSIVMVLGLIYAAYKILMV